MPFAKHAKRPTASASSPGQEEYMCLDPEDFLVLIVSREDSPTGLVHFIVDRSHVVALSQTWREIVERRSSRNWLGSITTTPIVLPDDDVDIIRLIMWIVYRQFHKLPEGLTVDELVRLGKAVGRYNVRHILIPHLSKWLSRYRRPGKCKPGHEEWLYVAFQFGLEKDYMDLADHLVLSCQINEENRLLNERGPIPWGTFPPLALGQSSRLL
ncbi:hypothetical protein N0V83_005977 [Neocucurbitaria cava]|uniref:Uncharacterized protein n=1 Tax=Neocucurbitaria cava TaxID=798079 RepID=A0A9W9CLJ1_9PLEO|nr:hypothetical protein N0V83_005977 [Neocucurbitaria cava]